jgi:ribonuclease HI
MYFINCDCSIQPFNPGGILAWGFIVKEKKKTIHKEAGISQKGGETATSNVGEYHAVIAALLWLISLPPEKRKPAIIRSDSELIVNQCLGIYSCNDEKLQPLLEMVQKARRQYGRNITFKWVSREENQEADTISRTAYDQDELAYWKENQLDILFDGDDISF